MDRSVQCPMPDRASLCTPLALQADQPFFTFVESFAPQAKSCATEDSEYPSPELTKNAFVIDGS